MIRRLTGFDRRADVTEYMDRANCDRARLRRTLEQFERINRFFTGSRRLLRAHVLSVIASEPARHYTLLDIGAGSGDIARWIVRENRRSGWHVRITALEPDERILPWLTDWVRDYPEIETRGGTVREVVEEQHFDFVFTNHVLHHVDPTEMPTFLEHCNRAAERALVLNDVTRSPVAWLGFAIYATLFLHRGYARTDGLRSIRRAYTRKELAALVPSALVRRGVRVIRTPPARVVVLRRATP